MAGGRPAMFKTVEEIQCKIDAYFESLEYEADDGMQSKPATLSGLAYFLGFSDRTSLYEYKEKPEFTNTIKRARLYIESMYEQGLQSKNSTGCIFALKNLGWKDKQEVENTVKISKFESMSDEDLQKELNKLGNE